MRQLLILITRNPVSLLGSAITTAGALLFLTFFFIGLTGFHGSPYVGILTYMVFPGIFVLGLLVIPVGVLWERRRQRLAAAAGARPPLFPVIDLNSTSTRRAVLIFLALTLVNLAIIGTATYKGVEVMDSNEFCGETCHSVMAPEYTAYLRSPHARVKCVSCHIGPGADWFVKSKLSGSWQVVSVNLGLYPKPIPTPVHNLRPARETCEQCHWPTKFVGDRLKVKKSYSEDEENTELTTVLLVRVGGVQGRAWQGIHWHVDPDVQVRYRSDETRESIHEVELTLPDGTVKRFLRDGEDGEGESGQATEADNWRVMDCVDCHNRPTHIYRLPEEEIDQALEKGRIPDDLPYVRREAAVALRGEYASHEEARELILSHLRGFYQENYPEVATRQAADIEAAAQRLGDIYGFNVFPSMNITWGTYPNHIGHQDFAGCFRCHDEELATEEGEVISQDCSLCHTLLAWDEEDPEVLATLNP